MGLSRRQIGVLPAHFLGRPTVAEIVHDDLGDANAWHALQLRRVPLLFLNVGVCCRNAHAQSSEETSAPWMKGGSSCFPVRQATSYFNLIPSIVQRNSHACRTSAGHEVWMRQRGTGRTRHDPLHLLAV